MATRTSAKVLAVTLSTYAGLVAADVFARAYDVRPLEPRYDPTVPRRSGTVLGLYRLDPGIGYTLLPGFRGQIEGLSVTVNSIGHRDLEPGQVDAMLVGDSFTFGAWLSDEETIAARMRARGVRAYSTGVSGYGPWQIVESMRRALPRVRPGHVVYLFYENDVNAAPPGSWAIEGGRIVERRPDMAGDPPRPLVDSLALLNLTRRDWRGSRYVDAAAQDVLAMRDLAHEHGATFEVFVVPTVTEVQQGAHLPHVERLMSTLSGFGLRVSKLIDRLEVGDYFADDLHLCARGADRVAEVIAASH